MKTPAISVSAVWLAILTIGIAEFRGLILASFKPSRGLRLMVRIGKKTSVLWNPRKNTLSGTIEPEWINELRDAARMLHCPVTIEGEANRRGDGEKILDGMRRTRSN